MSIDWITVIAQVVNFLILVWLLKRFLYRPILDGIDAREAEITDRMSEAARIREKATAVQATYEDQLSTLHTDESAMMKSTHQKAEIERDALLKKARETLVHERKEWAVHLKEETRKYTTELHRAGTEALLSLTRKALTDLADETLEERIVARVATRLAPMADELRKAAGESKEAIAVTRDPLPKNACNRLKADLKKLLPDVTLNFETDAEQAPGMILRLGGAQVNWTVDTYIDGLEELLEEKINGIRKKRSPNR